jgi:hypothetical protein
MKTRLHRPIPCHPDEDFCRPRIGGTISITLSSRSRSSAAPCGALFALQRAFNFAETVSRWLSPNLVIPKKVCLYSEKPFSKLFGSAPPSVNTQDQNVL